MFAFKHELCICLSKISLRNELYITVEMLTDKKAEITADSIEPIVLMNGLTAPRFQPLTVQNMIAKITGASKINDDKTFIIPSLLIFSTKFQTRYLHYVL